MATAPTRTTAPTTTAGGHEPSLTIAAADPEGGGSLLLLGSPGRHRIRTRIDWTGSPEVEVDVAGGEHVVFDVHPTGSALRFDQMFGRTTYLRLRHA